MRKAVSLFNFVFMFTFLVNGQTSDTVALNYYQVADSVYGNLGTHISSGYLLNRTLMDTNALAKNTDKLFDSLVNADYFYGLMDELKHMGLDSSSIPKLMSIYENVNSFMGEIEFEEDIYIYPIGVVDFNFQWLDEETAIQNGWISKFDSQYFDNANSELAYQTYNAKMMAPMFDYYSSDIMGIVFKPEYFYSNTRNYEEIDHIKLEHNMNSFILELNEIYESTPSSNEFQEFKVTLYYDDGDSIVNRCKIHTPELAIKDFAAKSSTDFPKCKKTDNKRGTFSDDDNNKLQYCFINSCNNNTSRYNPRKPYILVTGFRPPIIGQSFKKTWNLYSSNHNHLLFDLGLNDYDIILIRFNIQWKPFQHGMQESADLFIEFLKDLNTRKIGNRHENVIQGSSMGADIVRLALLKMEKLHFEDDSYPHHHSRLYNAYDANFFGANIPLAYQYQIYSGFYYPNLFDPLSVPKTFFRTFLFATMQQKTVKELLMYHATAWSNNMSFPESSMNWKPYHHPLRQSYYNALDQYDNQQHIFPIQIGTRNIAISLGKISGTNDQDPDLNFNQAGEYWRNQNILFYRSQLRAGVYTTSNTRLFKRRRLLLKPFPFIAVDHEVNVREMQEIDNAPGSYIRGTGNIISVTDWTYFTLQNIFSGRRFFSHKSTFTALGINPNLWPANGSHTLNMQDLNLMFNNYDDLNDNISSNYFGYPNLGRPNDHFEVTPFEAIYVGERIHPHIVLKNSLPDDVDAINDFILNEVEPWYLGLQNQNLGAQARSNYTYRAHRRAKYRITTGHLVTPKTNPGDYNVEPNADLWLEAGESIHLKPGTHIKAGAKAHLFINYYACSGSSGMMVNSNNEANANEASQELNQMANSPENEKSKTDVIKIFPNPSQKQFTLASMQDVPIQSLSIFNLNGKLVHSEENIDAARYECSHNLERGTYFIVINCIDGSIHRKKIVLL